VERDIKKEQTQTAYTTLYHYFSKMKGDQVRTSSVPIKDSMVSAAGSFIAILVISGIAMLLGYPMILGPMGASCLLVFAAHAGPFSQPRQIFGGHLVASITALSIWDIFGRNHITIGITLALILFLMIVMKLVHPPAAASGMVAINTQAGWGFLVTIAVTSIVLIIISVLYNNFFKDRQYPKQWM
jgi:CBS-domain-containing membrane protein